MFFYYIGVCCVFVVVVVFFPWGGRGGFVWQMGGMDMQQGMAGGYPVGAGGMVHNMGVRFFFSFLRKTISKNWAKKLGGVFCVCPTSFKS